MSALVEISAPTESSQPIEPQVVSTPSEMLPLSAERKAIFLSTLVTTGGNITRAADLIGMSRQNVLRWVQTDPVFAELFHDAIEAGTDHLEEAAYNRALSNSDRIMEFLLRARRPEKYRDNPRGEVDIDIDVSALANLLRAVCERARAMQSESAMGQVGQLAVGSGGGPLSSSAATIIDVTHSPHTLT